MADSNTLREIGVGLGGFGRGMSEAAQGIRAAQQLKNRKELIQLEKERARQQNIQFAAGILDANPEDSEAFIEEVLIENVWGGDAQTAKASPRFKTLVGVFKNKDTNKRKVLANSLRAFGIQGGDITALASMPLPDALAQIRAQASEGRQQIQMERVQERFEAEGAARNMNLGFQHRRESRIERSEQRKFLHDQKVLDQRVREFENLAQKRSTDIGVKLRLQELKEREFEQRVQKDGVEVALKIQSMELNRDEFELNKDKFTDSQKRFQLTHRLDLDKLYLQSQAESRQRGALRLAREKFHQEVAGIGDSGRLKAGLALKAKGKDPKNELLDQLTPEEADFLLGEILNAGMSGRDALLAVAIPSLRGQLSRSGSIRERTAPSGQGQAPAAPAAPAATSAPIRIDEDGNVISR